MRPNIPNLCCLQAVNTFYESKFLMAYYKRISYFSFTMSLIARVLSIEVTVHLSPSSYLTQTHQVIALTTLLHNFILLSCYYSFCTVVLTYNSSLSLVISEIEGGVQVDYNRLVPRDLHSSNEDSLVLKFLNTYTILP